MLNIFAHELNLCLAQFPVTGGKPTEPQALKHALKELIEHYPFIRLFTADALFTQRPLAGVLLEADRDYRFAVKDNQPELLEAILTSFRDAAEREPDAQSVEKKASSAESVGAFWLGEVTAVVSTGQVRDLRRPQTVRLPRHPFHLVVAPLDGPRGDLPAGSEPVSDRRPVGADAPGDRLHRRPPRTQHAARPPVHSSRNLPAHQPLLDSQSRGNSSRSRSARTVRRLSCTRSDRVTVGFSVRFSGRFRIHHRDFFQTGSSPSRTHRFDSAARRSSHAVPNRGITWHRSRTWTAWPSRAAITLRSGFPLAPHTDFTPRPTGLPRPSRPLRSRASVRPSATASSRLAWPPRSSTRVQSV